MGLKLFECDGTKSYGYGAHDSYWCLVVANTASEAIGMAIHEYGLNAENWDAVEIDLSTAGIVSQKDQSN